jgi:molybdopterin molybdotransferase
MSAEAMISVEEALARVRRAVRVVPAETVSLADGLGRVLASDLAARVSHPPFAVSAMDGYAVRAEDVARTPATLTQVGAVPAGGSYAGTVGPGETVRIFTGGRLPDGADAIVIQENVEAAGEKITVAESVRPGLFVRPAGLDFAAGAVGLSAGRRLNARDIGLAASMNQPWLPVRRRPRVAILATGDEIVFPGDPLGPNQIVGSNSHAVAAAVQAFGGEPFVLGIARDQADALKAFAGAAEGADLLITTGGVSVGEHDLVRRTLEEIGFTFDFWKIAMRPGKPLTFGRRGEGLMLGLPGNPVSALVCSLIFVKPLLRAMLGLAEADETLETAKAGRDLAANDERQEYSRAHLNAGADGELVATPFEKQDSAMLSLLTEADGLIVRPPFAPPARAGEAVRIIRFGPELYGL